MTEERISVEYIPIAEIQSYSKNPRRNEKSIPIVMKSISQYGFLVPIILDKNNVIVAGHTRIESAKRLGMTEVPVIWADNLTDEQIRGFRIMDNKSIEYSDWNYDLLKDEIIDLSKLNYPLDLTGLSENEISKFIQTEEDDFEEPKEAKYKIEKGEIWQLGRHRIMCGDCTNKADVGALMQSLKANMILTDPPYNVDYSSKNDFLNKIDKGNRNQTPIENDNIIDFKKLIVDFLKVIPYENKNTVYLFTSGKEIANVINAFSEAGLYYSQDLKWIKNNHVLGRLDYNPKSENIIYGWMGKHEFYGDFQTDVLNFDKPLVSKEHPTMKPINLLSELIRHGSRQNEIVYDGFLGSGSTLIACEQTNRTCYGMEIDPFYCSVIIERFEKLTKQQAVKL